MSLFEELTDEEAPAIPVEIIPEVVGENPLTFHVKQLPPHRIQYFRDKQAVRVGGQRQDAASIARRRHAFLTELYTEALEPRWENATEANLSALLRRAKGKLGDSAIEAIKKNGGELPFSIATVVALVKVCHDADLDAPLWQAIQFGAEQEAKAKGEDASGSEASA